MAKRRKVDDGLELFIRAVERAYSEVAVVEDAAWDVAGTAVAAELMEAVAALDRALDMLRSRK